MQGTNAHILLSKADPEQQESGAGQQLQQPQATGLVWERERAWVLPPLSVLLHCCVPLRVGSGQAALFEVS